MKHEEGIARFGLSLKIRGAFFGLGAAMFGFAAAASSFAGDSTQGAAPAVSQPPANLLAELNGKGVAFPFTYYGEVFGNFSGGEKRGVVYGGLLNTGVALDLEKLVGWHGASFLASALYPHGAGLSPAYVRPFNTISNITAYNSVRLYELWGQQNFAGDAVSIRVGQMLADTEFFVCDHSAVLLSSAFGALPTISFNLAPPIFPTPTPGVRVRVNPGELFYVQAGIYDGNAGDQTTGNKHGVSWKLNGGIGVLALAEVGYKLNQRQGDKGLRGTYKLGGFYHSPGENNNTGTPQHCADGGGYFIADQQLWRGPGGDDCGLSGFLQLSAAPENCNLVSFDTYAGLSYKGALRNRADDVCALGVSYTKVSGDFRDENGVAPQSHHEAIIELTYLAAINRWLSVQPDLQYIFNPGATGAQRDAVVGGIRFTLGF